MRHPTSIIDYMDLSKLYNCIYATRMRHPTLIKHVRVISEYNHHLTQVVVNPTTKRSRP
jgi:hypothetical protein